MRSVRYHFLRHGETDLSAKGGYCGSDKGNLTPRGEQQISSWQAAFADLDATQFFSSPYPRAVSSVERLTKSFDVLDDLKEWDLGNLEGLHTSKYRLEHPNWNLFKHGPPDESGENVAQIIRRAQRVLGEISERLDEATENVVVVCHGQFIRVLCSQLLDVALGSVGNLAVSPAGLSIFDLPSEGSNRLLAWNLHSSADLNAYARGNF